jgi:hypothetical protein
VASQVLQAGFLEPDPNAFDCPHCGAFAHQAWAPLWKRKEGDSGDLVHVEGLRLARCARCLKSSFWIRKTMFFPPSRTGPAPVDDMPDAVRSIYEEARAVSQVSPRSAAALLRLALQVLIDELEPGSANINTKIGRLVRRGLSTQVQQAMDVLRVVGNNAVHPGQINLDGDGDLVPSLFVLVNLIVEQVVSRPNHVAALFDALPESARQSIGKRDAET